MGGMGALAYDTIPSWTLTWTNAANSVGTLVTDAAHGGWTLNVRKNTYYGGYGLTLGIYSGKAFYGSAVASGGGDTGELDMRGTITGPGLDGTGTSTEWKIANMPDACLRTDDGNGNANPAYAVKILRTPGTLLTWGPPYHNDGLPHPIVTEVYVDEPEITAAVPSWFCSGCESLTVFTLKVPKVETLSAYIAHYRTPRAATSFDDYDLSSVKTITGHEKSGGTFCSWLASGTLDLPSLETISISNAVLNAGNLGAVLLGTRGTLKRIGEKSFAGCNNLTNVVFGASPDGVTTEIGPSAFAGTKIKNVWFAGVNPPDLMRTSGTYTFGTAATPEGQITFYVPDTPGWADVLAQRDESDLVPASVFNTANRQKVLSWGGVTYLKAVSPADRTLAQTHGDAVAMSGSASNPSGFPYATEGKGFYLLPVTLTASTSGTPDAEGRGSAFYRWSGVPLAQERENPLTIQSGGQMDVRAFFAHDWVYDSSAQTIANGNWVINVSVVDANSRTLRIGANTANPENATFSTAFTGTGSGVLDFNGHVRDAQGNEWTLVTVKGYAMCRARTWVDATDSTQTFADHPEMVVFPETLTSMDANVFNFNQSRNFPLAEVILIAPNLTGELRFVVNGPMLLNRMTLRVPKVTKLGNGLLWQNAQLKETDVTDWDFSSVTSVGDLAFGSSTGMQGILKLPALVGLGHRNFERHSKLSGVVLATNLTLTTVGSNAFLNATALRSVTVGNSPNGVTISQNAFKGVTGVSTIEFLGPRDETLADATLTGVTATTGAKTATIRASPLFGWNESVSQPEGDEVAAMPAAAAGVYRAGSRKAWLEYVRSPFEPRGTILVFR